MQFHERHTQPSFTPSCLVLRAKKRHTRKCAFFMTPSVLQRTNFSRLRALGAILDFELNFLTFVQAAIATAFYGRKMCKNIGTAGIRGDEPKTLFGIEPLDFACLNHDL